MDWFKNLNAAPRLPLSFGLLIMLIAAISCLAIINLRQANDQIKGLIQNSLEKSRRARSWSIAQARRCTALSPR
jgi:hypothetical protein